MHQNCGIHFFVDFGLTLFNCKKLHRSGILFHVIASNNISTNVKTNSYFTSSEQSFICFSLINPKQRKSQQQLMYRQLKKFNSKLSKLCLKFDAALSFDEARHMYLKFEEIFLDSVLPLELKTFTKYQCSCFGDNFEFETTEEKSKAYI